MLHIVLLVVDVKASSHCTCRACMFALQLEVPIMLTTGPEVLFLIISMLLALVTK